MSNYTNHMGEDDELYRGVLQYEMTPMEWVDNPNYRPNGPHDYSNRDFNTWGKKVYVPTGQPDETVTDYIGPYSGTRPIKSYVTRHRGSKKNLRILRIEKVSEWEEVSI